MVDALFIGERRTPTHSHNQVDLAVMGLRTLSDNHGNTESHSNLVCHGKPVTLGYSESVDLATMLHTFLQMEEVGQRYAGGVAMDLTSPLEWMCRQKLHGHAR